MATEGGRHDAALSAGLEALRITADAVAALAGRSGPSLAAAAELVRSRPGSVVVTGLGKSGLVGAKLAATFASTGTPSFFVHAADALHGDSGMVREGDVLLALSNSGETAEVTAFADLVRARGVPVLAMTGCGGGSSLADRAAVLLDARAEREADPNGLAPTASTSVCLALGDALAVTLLSSRGFGPADFHRFHPGGALGAAEAVASERSVAAEPDPGAPAAVCVVGSFMMDLVVRTPALPVAGETVLGASMEQFLGGKGFNQAVAAARSGAATAMVGRLGADGFGEQFLDALRREGIGADHVARDRDVGTGTGLPVVDAAGRNSIVVVPLANARCRPGDVEAAAPVLSASEVVLAQLELPVESVAAAFGIARRHGATTVLDPAPARGDLDELVGLVDVVVPNESEAEVLIGSPLTDPAAGAAAVARRLGASVVVLTLGGEGAVVWRGGEVTRVAGHDVEVRDTVGAGDAFCGAMVAALAAGEDLHGAVRRGNAAGALAVTVAGAEPSMPTGAAVEELLGGAVLTRAGEQP